MELRCKKVLITGGAGGIGMAIARRLLEDGAEVTIAGRTLSKLDAAWAELDSARAHRLLWDVSHVEDNRARLEEAAALMGGLDGLVNNAGLGTHNVTGRGYEPWDITGEEWDTLMDTNLKGAFFAMRDTVDYMLEQGIRGNILNIASNAACMEITGSYGAAKTALIRMTRAFGEKYGDRGIIINGIAPGATFTPIISRYARNIDDPYPRHAIGRFIRPEEIAELAAYLMSNFGEIICGHTVVADGGDRCATL